MSRLNVAFSVDVSPDRNWLAAFMFNSPREGACLVLAFFWRIAPTSRGGFSSSLRNLEKTLLIYSLPISRMEGMEKSEDTWAKRFFPGISKEISAARKETFSSSFEKSGREALGLGAVVSFWGLGSLSGGGFSSSPRNLEKTLLIYSLPILRMGGMEKSEDTWAKRFFPGISKEISPARKETFSSSFEKSGSPRNLEKTLLIYSLPILRMGGMEKSEDTWAKRFFPGISKEISPARKETFSSSFEKSGREALGLGAVVSFWGLGRLSGGGFSSSLRNLEKTLLIYSLPILRMGGMEKSEDTWAKRFFPGISKEISPARKETFSS